MDSKKVCTVVNNWRKMYGAPPLTWSTKLASEAQAWADKGVFRHASDTGGAGENLYCGPKLQTDAADAIACFMREAKAYDYANPGFSHAAGHFTQMVWVGSKEIGVGCAKLPTGMYMYVFRFAPRGNVIGRFQQHVKPKAQVCVEKPM